MNTPESIAKALYEVLVVERVNDDLPERFEIPEIAIPSFRAKVELYREAIILMMMLPEIEGRVKLREVLAEYEKIIFGTISSPNSLRKLNDVKAAMRDLNMLLDPEGKPRGFTWAREWLHEIGHEEHDPVTLSLFANYWMREVATAGESISDMKAQQIL